MNEFLQYLIDCFKARFEKPTDNCERRDVVSNNTVEVARITTYSNSLEVDYVTVQVRIQQMIDQRSIDQRFSNCLNCKYFSGSSYLKCAVKPSGEASDCLHFEKREH